MAQAKIYYDKLRYLGFIDLEARGYCYATTPGGALQPFDEIYESVGFQKIIQARQEFIARQKTKGLTGKQISDGIEFEYRLRQEESPHSLLKDEYRPNAKPRLDFDEGIKRSQLRKSRKNNYKS